MKRNIMGNFVVSSADDRKRPNQHRQGAGTALFSCSGARKYLNRAERQRVIAMMMRRRSDADLFGLTLAFTGARVSEVLALSPAAFDLEAGLVTLRTLKRRQLALRQIPLPADVLRLLDRRYRLSRGAAEQRLWRFDRTTAWRHMRRTMEQAGVAKAIASPRGLRHGFGVGTLQAGVPITLLQRWLGHARLTTTAIYAQVSGPEERAFADGFWRWSKAAS